MTIRRFVDIIGIEQLNKGSHVSECGREQLSRGRYHGALLNGKEAFILSHLYFDWVGINPYLHGSDLYYAYRGGVEIERADLQDVVRRCRA
jgi:hypothetical protein